MGKVFNGFTYINYEDVEPFDLKVVTSDTKTEHKRTTKKLSEAAEPEALYAGKTKIKTKLKAEREKGIIEIDDLTTITGVPADVWEDQLGNRSALEWVLDQYKEKNSGDKTIEEKFKTYRFADYKEHVIELLKKICTVSVETVKIIREMEKVRSPVVITTKEEI